MAVPAWVRRAVPEGTVLPAITTALLFGLSFYSSLIGGGDGGGGGGGGGGVGRELRSTSIGFDDIARAMPPVPVPKVTCDIGAAENRATLLRAGGDNLKASADACRRSCQHHQSCNAWVWCDDHRGCADEKGHALPPRGCQLRSEPLTPTGIPGEGAPRPLIRHSQHTVGFVKRRVEGQETFLRTQSAPGTRVLLTTYVPPANCSLAEGSRVAAMSVANMRDYAKWHSYALHLETGTADAGLRPAGAHDAGAWNKVAILRKLLAAHSPAEAEWLLWMEPDSLFDDPSFTFPFEFYQGNDLVTVGDVPNVLRGRAKALSTGVLLFRNSQWTRELLDELAAYARRQPATAQAEPSGSTDPVATGMMAIFRQRGLNATLPRLRFEGEFCLACDWRRIDLRRSSQVTRTSAWGEENKSWKLFVTRFFDCDLCWGRASRPAELQACLAGFREHYVHAYCRFHRMSQAVERERRQGGLLQSLEQLGIPANGFNHTAFSQPAAREQHLLTSPQRHTTNSAQACYEACLKSPRCGRWVWCSHSAGCDDMGTFRGSFPTRGCELSAVDNAQSPYAWDRGPQFSSFASGYIPADHPARRGWAGRVAQRGSGAAAAGGGRLAIGSGLATAPCSTPHGDAVMRLAVQNRQDYARLHGLELHLMAESVDPRLRMGAWQKLGLMKQMLAEIPRERAEWVAWVDIDIVFLDLLFEIPLHKYAGKDFVIWGQREKMLAGDVLNGVNSGVFLVRNTDWSRAFLDAWTPFGAFPPDHHYDEVLRDNVVNFDVGMFEQNAIVYLAHTQPALMEKIALEGDYCLNCWYKDAFKPNVVQPPFVVHFAGCQICTGFHPEKLGDCDREMVRLYVESHAQLRAWAAGGGKARGRAGRQHALLA